MTEGETEGVGDAREKHVSVTTRSGKRVEHGDVYLRHADDAFLVSPEKSFPPAETTRYPKRDLLRVEITQHHSACFLTTATAGEGPELEALRGFRDNALARTAVGRGLVRVYYAVSPPVAATLARHPDARTTRAVRRLVEGCAGLAHRRSRADRSVARLGLSVLLTLTYLVGLMTALIGHAGIRALESSRGDRLRRGPNQEQPGRLGQHRQHADEDQRYHPDAGRTRIPRDDHQEDDDEERPKREPV